MKKLSKTKKITLSIVALLILVVVGVIVSIPIRSGIEHSRFTKLDVSQKSIYDEIVKVAGGSEKWNYRAACIAERTGPWATGEYTCSTTISTEKQVTSVNELNDLQSKYYPVVDGNIKLRHVSELNIQSPENFGKKFVVSGAQKNYVDKSSGVECVYRLNLGQAKPSLENSVENSIIGDGTGIVSLSLSCKSKSGDAWF